jgi:hypothetical protein
MSTYVTEEWLSDSRMHDRSVLRIAQDLVVQIRVLERQRDEAIRHLRNVWDVDTPGGAVLEARVMAWTALVHSCQTSPGLPCPGCTATAIGGAHE